MLEEVIVTAQKREQNLQDVPIAVTAFTGETLKLTGANDLVDLASNAPSLLVDQVQSSNAPAFGIRAYSPVPKILDWSRQWGCT